MSENVTLPSIHLNGTSKKMLLDGWKGVVKNIFAVEDSLERVEFNQRDYYVRDGAWQDAQNELAQALVHLKNFKRYAMAMRDGIAGGGHRSEG